jgi:DNA gyrase subunit A
MGIPERPNLDGIDSAVRAYIEALEAELERLRGDRKRPSAVPKEAMPLEPAEPPTTINVITISASGLAKRTPRHLYSRQRRGGMGVFDLDAPQEDEIAFLAVVDESQSLALITNKARAFRLPVSKLSESAVRSRGQSLADTFSFRTDERLAVVLPIQSSTYVALLTARGYVRWQAGNLLGANLRAGTILYDVDKMGFPVAACWTSSSDELFIATRWGVGIRFSARQVPTRGCLGIQLKPGDMAAAIAAVQPESGVLMLGADGKGTVRLMSGFRPNKSPGSGGKIAMRTDHLVGAMTVGATDDVFIASRLGKVIRFRAAEVPAKGGVVQGVNCMTLRADKITAFTLAPISIPPQA